MRHLAYVAAFANNSSSCGLLVINNSFLIVAVWLISKRAKYSGSMPF